MPCPVRDKIRGELPTFVLAIGGDHPLNSGNLRRSRHHGRINNDLWRAPRNEFILEREVRATFERFVAAQNKHDVKAVESLLLNSSDFLWITRGTPVWGSDAALKRFIALY